ncbi:MAG TPA: hypothetical protein VL574_06875 [Stellaceae bacterium]|nr:hypothetical protein [Stellaceae bacterium]
MAEKAELKTLAAEARNARRLAGMTTDPTARACLERIAERHEAERVRLVADDNELIKDRQAREESVLSLDRVSAIGGIASPATMLDEELVEGAGL